MSQANVYYGNTAAGQFVINQNWYTDKARITVVGANAVVYGVFAPALTYIQSNGTPANAGPMVGNIYSAMPAIAPGTTKDIYVGVGNKLSIYANDTYYGNSVFTVQELGTASSAQAGSNGVGNG